MFIPAFLIKRSNQKKSKAFISPIRQSKAYRSALLLFFVCSACKPLFSTDSTPASPEKIVNLAPTYRLGKIAIAPPLGWQPVKVSGIKYPVFSLDPSTSISLVEENLLGSPPSSLEVFIQTNLQGMAIAFQNWRQISQADFQTTKGMSGKVVISQSQQLNVALHQRLYFFTTDSSKAQKLIVICGGKLEAAAELESTCNASVKTLVVSP